MCVVIECFPKTRLVGGSVEERGREKLVGSRQELDLEKKKNDLKSNPLRRWSHPLPIDPFFVVFTIITKSYYDTVV